MRFSRPSSAPPSGSILDAVADARLFGSAFAGDTWTAWEAFLAAVFGLPMTGEQLETFRGATGRVDAPVTPCREAWCVAGRRAGKSRVAAAVAVFLAAFRDYRDVLARGEVGTLPIVAADRRQARTVMGYVSGLIDGSPLLAQLVRKRTAESIELSTRCRIEIHTASWRALRGYTVIGAVLDEVCFWRSEDSLNPDHEIVNALRPAMATVPNAVLVAISSPYSRRGIAWETFRRHHGPQGDPAILTWQSPTRVMNPCIPERLVADALAADEAAARAEYLAEWRRDIEGFLTKEVVDACTIPGRQGLPPLSSENYVGFVDPSGGSADSFTLAIAHAESRGGEVGAVLDLVLERRPPFSPSAVVKEFAGHLKLYGVGSVVGDRYGGEFPRELFREHGIAYVPSERVKSDLYRELLPMLTAGRVELLDDPTLHTQLIGLERRVARGGKDSIDHGPAGRDDLANSAAGALVVATTAGAGACLIAANLEPSDVRRGLRACDTRYADDLERESDGTLTVYPHEPIDALGSPGGTPWRPW
jgi:hypothetical protein